METFVYSEVFVLQGEYFLVVDIREYYRMPYQLTLVDTTDQLKALAIKIIFRHY